MIKINLANRKRSVAVVAGAQDDDNSRLNGTFNIKAFKTSSRLDGMDDFPVRKIALLVVVMAGGWYLLDEYQTTELAKVDASLMEATAEGEKIQANLAKSSDHEAIKKALESDEGIIRNKIETVQKLIDERQTPPRLLLALSSGIPDEVWIEEFKIQKEEVRFVGGSIDNQKIIEFMKTINESTLFRDVNLKNTEKRSGEEGNVISFELVAKRKIALEAREPD